jgi:hypothetical protein
LEVGYLLPGHGRCSKFRLLNLKRRLAIADRMNQNGFTLYEWISFLQERF